MYFLLLHKVGKVAVLVSYSLRKNIYLRLKKSAFQCLLSLFLFSSVFSAAFASDFLSVNISVGSAACADGISLASPISETYINPAFAARIFEKEISFSHSYMFESFKYSSVSYGFFTPIGSFSASYMQSTAWNSSLSFAYLKPFEHLALFSYGRKLSSNELLNDDFISAGASLKIVKSDFSSQTYAGVLMDLGFIYSIPFLDDFTLSSALKNIFSSAIYDRNATPFPLSLDTGLLYRYPAVKDFAATASVLLPENRPSALSLGVSFSPIYFLKLCSGWKSNTSVNSDTGFSYGFTIALGAADLNYAMTNARGTSQVQSIGVDIPLGTFSGVGQATSEWIGHHYERAVRLFQKNKLLESRSDLEQILALYPDYEQASEFIAEIDRRLESSKRDNQSLVDNFNRLANNALEKNDLLISKRHFNMALLLDPQNSEAQRGVGAINTKINEMQSEKMRIEKKSEIMALWKDAIKSYRNERSLVSPKIKFEKILAIDPANEYAKDYITRIDNEIGIIKDVQINELFMKGVDLFNEGKYQEAKGYFQAVQSAAPNRLDAVDYFKLCDKKMNEIEVQNKANALSQEQKRYRNELDEAMHKAMNFYNIASYSNSLSWFEKTHDIAVKYAFNAEKEEAVRYMSIIKKFLSEYYYKSGFNYYQKNRYDAAYAEYRKALDFDPNNSSVYTEYTKLGKLLSDQYYERGMSSYTKSEMKRAKENFIKALQYDSTNSGASRALERLGNY